MRKPFSSTKKGAVLGVLNILAIAAVIGVIIKLWPTFGRLENVDPESLDYGPGRFIDPHAALDTASLVAFIGILPGIVFGAFLGLVSDWLASKNRVGRIAIVGLIACLVTAAFGAAMELGRFILPACAPTLLATIALDFWIHRRVSPHERVLGSIR